ncbi:hypothetical protein [Caballeronia sp. INDeC2]|uniref:hypothetical protein n=1 Tax=Caballeronia sp. INDeC2 TaxID=2921747 RepID=UPI0020286ED4|nr:hypothetical protein [Caballeronia sp. INDeC2]
MSSAVLSEAAFALDVELEDAASSGPHAQSASSSAAIRRERHGMSGLLLRSHAMKKADASVLMLRESFVKRLREVRSAFDFFHLYVMIRVLRTQMKEICMRI